MKFLLLKIIILFFLFLQNNHIQAKTIYQWVDQSGKRHFSDKQPGTDKATKFSAKSLVSIDTVQTKPIKSLKIQKPRSAKRSNNRSSKKLNGCEKLSRKIEAVENKLKQHLKAEKSDQYSRELNNLRWQKIKSC